MGIKLYNNLPEKINQTTHTHTIILKKELQSILLQNAVYTVEEYLQAAL